MPKGKKRSSKKVSEESNEEQIEFDQKSDDEVELKEQKGPSDKNSSDEPEEEIFGNANMDKKSDEITFSREEYTAKEKCKLSTLSLDDVLKVIITRTEKDKNIVLSGGCKRLLPKKTTSVVDFDRDEYNGKEKTKVSTLSTEDLLKVIITRTEEYARAIELSEGCKRLLCQINGERLPNFNRRGGGRHKPYGGSRGEMRGGMRGGTRGRSRGKSYGRPRGASRGRSRGRSRGGSRGGSYGKIQDRPRNGQYGESYNEIYNDSSFNGRQFNKKARGYYERDSDSNDYNSNGYNNNYDSNYNGDYTSNYQDQEQNRSPSGVKSRRHKGKSRSGKKNKEKYRKKRS